MTGQIPGLLILPGLPGKHTLTRRAPSAGHTRSNPRVLRAVLRGWMQAVTRTNELDALC